MLKKSLTYNPDSLQFEPVDKGCKGKIFRFILYLTGGLLSVLFLYFVYISNFETVKEQRLKLENQTLLSKYDMLNKELSNLESNLEDIAEKDDHLYRAMLGKQPLGDDLRNAGIGGTDRYKQFEKYENYDILKNTTQNIEILLSKLQIQNKSFNEITEEAQDHQLLMNSKPSIQPVSTKEYRRISSKFGMRTDPVHGHRQMHRGLDFAGPVGSKIYATGDGVVKTAYFNRHGYGNEIIITHHGGFATRYAHLDKLLVKKGEKVKRGQVIGLMGNTGKSTGPHLHYEVIVNGRVENPSDYYFNNLSVEEFEQIIKFSQEN